MKKRIAAMALAMIVLCASFVSAEEIPSLFHNDDPWYKDGVSPMIERDGVRYIPADIFTMFDTMKVSTPRSDNLLIHNTETGAYVSILFMERSALINGKVHEQIGVFRDGGVYYVEADTVCEGLGFTTRLYIQENGDLTMQVCDGDVISTSLTELIRSYLPADEEYAEEELQPETPLVIEESSAGVIYLFCGESDANDEFPALSILEKEKLAYTLFFTGNSDPRTVIRQSIGGICGLDLPDIVKDGDFAAVLDGINTKFTEITRTRLSLTLSTGDDGTDETLRNAGYCPVKPDFEVNGGSDPDRLIGEILAEADEKGWCTVYLDDCWNTVVIARMLGELNENEYRTANFAYRAPGK